MPWNIEDVESHKKGLNDKGKRQWVRVANSVLKRLMGKGMAEKEAATEAIKQANGVINANKSENYAVYKNKQVLDYEVKLVVHQEKAHLVVPVVLMVEGVHNGSLGPIFHSIEELGKYPESWNGIPVVIYHPEEDGVPVSANTPDILDNIMVGKVYNTSVEGKKLKAEVWFDEEKLNTVSPTTLQEVNDMKEMEVSLGMYADYKAEKGVFNEELYETVAINHRPDHLAILPDQIGACSCADGCGLGANEKNKNMGKLIDVEKTIKLLNSEGYSIQRIENNVEQDYQKRINMVNDALRSLDEHVYHYMEEVYDSYLIYSKSDGQEYKMYKQDYKIENGKVEFVGASAEVHKKVEYVVNSGMTRNKFSTNNKKEDTKMPKNECPKCLVKINAVIANKESGFVEADREWLEVLSEIQLDKAITPKVKEVVKVEEKTVEVNKLTPEQTADLAFVANMRKENRTKKITSIVANTEKGTWDEATLNTMSEDVLDRVFKSVKKVEEKVDYSLNGEVIEVNTGSSTSGGILLPPNVKVETSK